MITGPEIALICRVAELARRFGLRPSEVDPEIQTIPERVDGNLVDMQYVLRFDKCTKYSETSARFDQMMKALGCHPSNHFILQSDDMSDLEDAVEAAFLRAPQPRLR
jgi:hypothetical protein